MAVTRVTGTWFDSMAGNNHVQLICSVPAGGWLHEADVQGMAMVGYNALTLTAAGWPFQNIAAGLQYGAVGHVPTGITDGTGAGETWLTFADGLPSVFNITDNLGNFPLGVVERASYSLELHWRGCLYFPVGADIHLEVGCNQGAPDVSTWRSFHSNSVVYTT